jgi:hypothetical protein
MSANNGPAFAFSSGVLAREVGGEMVLLNLESEQYYGLDRVGADIVDRLVRTPRDEAMAALRDDYEVDPTVLEHDVERLIAGLIAAGLLETTDARE